MVTVQVTVGEVIMGSKPFTVQVKQVQSLTCQLRPALVTTQSLSSGMLNSMAAPFGPMRWLVGCIRMASCTLRGSRSAWARDMSSMGRQGAASAVWGSSLLSRAMRTVESVFQSVAVWRARGDLLWPAGCQVAVAKLKLCLQQQEGSAFKEAQGGSGQRHLQGQARRAGVHVRHERSSQARLQPGKSDQKQAI